MAAKLKTMAIFEVNRLEVVHRMKHQADILVQSSIQCGIERSLFYVVKNEVPQLHKSIQVTWLFIGGSNRMPICEFNENYNLRKKWLAHKCYYII